MAGNELNAIVIKLCAYYNFNIKMATSNQIHPRVEAVKEYFEKLPVDKYEAYYKKLTGYCQFFPNVPQLAECYNAIMTVENYKPVTVGLNEAAENYVKTAKTSREEVLKQAAAAFKCGVEMTDGQYDTWIRDVRRRNRIREEGRI